MTNKTIRVLAACIISIAFLLFFARNVGFDSWRNQLLDIRTSTLFGAATLLVLSYVFRVVRLQVLLRIKSSVLVFHVTAVNYFLNRILPFRLGELSLPLLLRKELNIKLSIGTAVLIYMRLVDLIVMVFLFSMATVITIKASMDVSVYLMLMFQFLFLIVLFFYFNQGVSFFIRVLSPFKNMRKLCASLAEVELFINQLNAKVKVKVLLFTIANWLFVLAFYYCIILDMSINLSYVESTFVSLLSSFTLILPISGFANVGTFETGWAIGFKMLGISVQEALPVGLFVNVFATIITGLTVVIAWLNKLLFRK